MQDQKQKIDSKRRTYDFALKIIGFIDKLPRDISSQIIAKQLLRAATSIGANIIEAQASPSRKDFTNFFNYSLKSANETKYWLNLLKDTNKIDKETIEILIKEVDEIANILGSSILTLKGKRNF
ncbi:MAG: four helix bundle protein [Candidatus Omnitrophota bacterium]